MTLSKQQPQVREGYMVKINGKFGGEENVLVFFLVKSGFIPLDAKEVSVTYLGGPVNQKLLTV